MNNCTIPEHITLLPPQIRQLKFKEPQATHELFGCREDIVLNYEHLLCGLSRT